MNRRIAAGLALGVAALLAVSACSSSKKSSGGGGNSGGNSGGSSSPVTLNFVGADYSAGTDTPSTLTYWQDIANAFHAANPNITVKVSVINWNDFDSQIKTRVQNKQYPDITEGDYFPDYAQEGLLYPAKQVLSSDTFNNLLATFAPLDSYNGTQYGMPWTTSSRAMFYNKKLFQQAGISTPPSTWAELQTDAGKIKSATGAVGFGMPLGPEEAQAEALLWFLGAGGGYQDSSGKWTINSPQNVEALQFMKGLVQAGDTEPNPGTKDRTKDVWTPFAQGKVGMAFGSPALVPSIVSSKVLTSSDYGVTPIPGKNGPLDKTLGVCDNVQVFKTDSKKLPAIQKFLDFAYQDQYQIKFDHNYDLLPATNSAVKALSSDPIFGPFLKALPNSVQYPSSPAWTQVKTQIQNTIGTAMSGNPKSVLDAIQQTAEKSS